jgi:hypothetical protein
MPKSSNLTNFFLSLFFFAFLLQPFYLMAQQANPVIVHAPIPGVKPRNVI